jgi:putative transposase
MRQPRHLEHNATYHVCALINRQEMIFQTGDFLPEMETKYIRTDSIKELFLNVLKDAGEKYKFSLKNFCIMGNHVHLLIKPLENESLSSIMQWILSVFAIRYNRLFKLKGHVWYDRFKSRIIQTFQQMINTFFYISNNPVRARLVKNPLSYLYNGICHILNNNYSLVDPPDSTLKHLIEDYIDNFNCNNVMQIDKAIGFYPGKPGRKKEK